MKGEQVEKSGCNESVEKVFNLSTEWKNDLIQLRKEIDNVKKVNDEREIKFTEWSMERIE